MNTNPMGSGTFAGKFLLLLFLIVTCVSVSESACLAEKRKEAKQAEKKPYRIRIIHRDKKHLHGSSGQMICIDRVVMLGTPFDVRADGDAAAAKGVLRQAKSGRLRFKGQIRIGYHVGTVDAPVELGNAIRPESSAGGPLKFPMFVLFEQPPQKAVEAIKTARGVHEKVLGPFFSKGDRLLVVPGPRPAKQKLSQWFQSSLKAKNDLTTDRETWALFQSTQLGDNDKMSIEKIERQGNTFTVIMNRFLYVGPLYRNVTFHEVHAVNLGKLSAGNYTVVWNTRVSAKDIPKGQTWTGYLWELKQKVAVRASGELPQASR